MSYIRWPAVEDIVQECEDHGRAMETEGPECQGKHGEEVFKDGVAGD